jgi:hypothetical protein
MKKIGLIMLAVLMLCSISFAAVESITVVPTLAPVTNKSILDSAFTDISVWAKFFAKYDWQTVVGGTLLCYEGKAVPEANLLIKKSPHDYISLNAVYPIVDGLSVNLNLKHVLGDIYFKFIATNVDAEARAVLEAKYSFLKYIRIDPGYFAGFESQNDSWKFKKGFNFNVIQYEF